MRGYVIPMDHEVIDECANIAFLVIWSCQCLLLVNSLNLTSSLLLEKEHQEPPLVYNSKLLKACFLEQVSSGKRSNILIVENICKKRSSWENPAGKCSLFTEGRTMIISVAEVTEIAEKKLLMVSESNFSFLSAVWVK